MSEKPSVLETISSPVTVLSIASSIDPLRPAARIVTKETSASPIIRAAAVIAVRPGLRIAFSRAIRPETPRKRSSGLPTTEAIGRTSLGLSRATPRKTVPAPTPTQASPGSSTPNSPSRIRAIPSAVRATPIAPCRRRWPLVSSTAPSRSPTTGGTRVARSAGISADPTVRVVPRSRETITVRLSTTVPSLGRSIPTLSKRAPIAGANAIPAKSPITEATMPIASASTTTAVMIWRRLAPRVRSSANSRVRWATVIEKVLKIRKAATKRATPAKTRRTVWRMPMNWSTSSRWESVFCSPVSTSAELGRTCSIRLARSSGETPSAAATLIWSNWPSLPVILWASGRVSSARLAPPKESTSPRVAIPTRVYDLACSLPARVT